MSIPTYEELLERNKKLLAENKAKALADSDQIYDTQESDVTSTYNKAIDNSKTSYEDEYERNAVGRLINEKRIAEKNASLGLTDSGLNRTQQTAVELSYANNKNKIDIARRKAADSLAEKLAEAVSSIRINKATARGNIENNYLSLAADNAQKEYKANLDAQTEIQKAALSALTKSGGSGSSSKSGGSGAKTGLITVNGGLVSRDFKGTLEKNKVTVEYNPKTDKYDYLDRVTGKKTSFPVGVNPFTGDTNQDIYKIPEGKKTGAFSNGYQPNNIDGIALKDSGLPKIPWDGQEQTIWEKKDDKTLWVWDGSANEYRTYNG